MRTRVLVALSGLSALLIAAIIRARVGSHTLALLFFAVIGAVVTASIVADLRRARRIVRERRP